MNAVTVAEGAGADRRKGWCPGARRPMPARDGLLVRVRPTAGVLSAEQAAALADLAERDGNGTIELTARANLQLRGVSNPTLPRLLDALDALELLDNNAAAEAVRNVIASPLAGLSSGPDAIDIRPLVTALERQLVTTPGLDALPPKFGFLVDDGAPPGLAEISADLRFDWHGGRREFAIGFGGTRRTATFAGWCAPAALAERGCAIARAVADAQGGSAPRRMRALLEAGLGPTLGLPDGAGELAPEWPDTGVPAPLVGQQTMADVSFIGLAAPFGRLDAAMMRHAAALAGRGAGTIRLTPWRALLIPGRFGPLGDAGGFITDARDPRLRVATCIGMGGCERGTTPTLDDADALASLAARLGPEQTVLHVSGCAKGCAKASATAITLVGVDGRYDLVRNGKAGDPPSLRRLDLSAVGAIIAELAA